jgi:hypothetical protein
MTPSVSTSVTASVNSTVTASVKSSTFGWTKKTHNSRLWDTSGGGVPIYTVPTRVAEITRKSSCMW